MTRSTVEPDPVEIKRTHDRENYFAVDLLIHWDANQITVEEQDGGSHQEWDYGEDKIHLIYETKPNLDDVRTWLDNNSDKLTWMAKKPYGLSDQEKQDLQNYIDSVDWNGVMKGLNCPRPNFGDVGEPDFVINWPSQQGHESNLERKATERFNKLPEVDYKATDKEDARKEGRKIGQT